MRQHIQSKTSCPECGGAGSVCAGHPNDPRARSFSCDGCGGTGELESGECSFECWCMEDAAFGDPPPGYAEWKATHGAPTRPGMRSAPHE
jgi:hypothetical protein